MNLLKKLTAAFVHSSSNNTHLIVKNFNIPSKYLARGVIVDIFLPPQYAKDRKQHFPVIYFNDGQDMPRLHMKATLENLFSSPTIEPFITVAIHCNENRINEYGTARQADYKNRGNKAAQYSDFVIHELMPFIISEHRCKTAPEHTVFAGFSLGALSALDIAWANPSVFGKVGVFSGSLWWRSREYSEQDPDGGRIMHDIIATSEYQKGMQFWFQVGTKDEDCDRNNNGVIDAIDDTLDLIDELAKLGYKPHEDIKYVEIEGGEHNPDTWGKVMPLFLKWAFGK
jgi:enterochelin esterase-like enzyme